MEFDLKKVLTMKDVAEAKKLVGKRVFRADCIRDLLISVTNDLREVNLESVREEMDDCPFYDGHYWRYIYPAEKELVPYPVERLDELVGKVVRSKVSGNVYLLRCHLKGEEYVGCDGGEIYSERLFREFEFLDGSPIGVEVQRMKYDKSRVITPFNRETAVVGKEYYFGDCQGNLEKRIRMGRSMTLRKVSDHSGDMHPFKVTDLLDFIFILPVDAVEVQE